MPYITQERRKKIDCGATPANCGELNYAVTMRLLLLRGRDNLEEARASVGRVVANYITLQPMSYQRINDVLGALEGARREIVRRLGPLTGATPDVRILSWLLESIASEFYRTVAASYEDTKIAANGDLPFAEWKTS